MINQTCSSLMYELGEFCSAMQKYQCDPSKDVESQKLKLYIASPSQVWDPDTLIGRIRMLLDRLWKWMTSNKYQGTLDEPIENIIHNLFDRVIQEGYQARQSHLAHQVQLIESHFKLNSSDEIKNAQKERYYKHLEAELQYSNSNLNGLAENFNSALQEGVLNESALDGLGHVVTNVSQAVKPFWEKMLFNHPTFAGPLKSYIPVNPSKAAEEKPIDWAITDLSLYKALSKEQEWINLETLMDQPVPVIELIKICDSDQTLGESEKRRLHQWIEGLNELSINLERTRNKLSHELSAVNLLRNVMDEIVQAVSIQGHFQINEGLLINKLDDYGCKLMRIEDSKQIAWRSKLKKGSTIRCDGETYRLGEELKIEEPPVENKTVTAGYRPLMRRRDRYKIFGLESHPHLVIKIGSSPFDLIIDNHKFHEFHRGIPAIDGVNNIKETDDKRSVLFLEKLPVLLSDYQWKSERCKLTEEDEKILSRVGSFLFCMCDWKKWLEGVTLKSLGINSAWIISSLNWFKGGPDDYLAAENFCIDTANNKGSLNLHVLRYLMEVSGYSKHRMAEFYRKNVNIMLKTGEFDFLNLSLPYGFNKPEYRKKVEDLFSQATALRHDCVEGVKQFIREKESPLKAEKARLLEEALAIKTEKPSVTEENKSAFKQKKRELERKFDELNDKKEELNGSIQRELLGYVQNWRHFNEEKKQLTEELLSNRKALNSNKKDLMKISSDQKDRLLQLNIELKLQKAELQTKIITYTVYDRLLEAYSDLPTAAWLPNCLFETVVNSFKNGRGLEKSVVDHAYYKDQQELIIAKNLHAIKLMQQAG